MNVSAMGIVPPQADIFYFGILLSSNYHTGELFIAIHVICKTYKIPQRKKSETQVSIFEI